MEREVAAREGKREGDGGKYVRVGGGGREGEGDGEVEEGGGMGEGKGDKEGEGTAARLR
jgi:hypothetical protein